VQLEFWEQQLPFEYPFTISNGRTKTHQHSLMVKLSLGNWVGYGEAPAIVYYNVTVQGMMEQLEKQRKLIEKFALIDPERFWHFLHHLFPQDPFLVCALDMAGWDLFGQMKKQSVLPLFADESCVFEKDVATCANYFHGINIKLTKCSGPTPALRMIKEAKVLGLKVMMGSMNESVIGSAAIAQFLPQLDYVDMDGPLLMTELNGVGLDFSFAQSSGKIAPLVRPGLGVQYRMPFKK